MELLSPTMEDYLEAIWRLSLKHKVARVKDVAKMLGVRTASVIGALKTLAEKDLIVHEKYGYIELTPQGEEEAQKIYRKHQAIARFFHEVLGVDPETAASDACRFEHYISKETLDRMTKFVEFIETCPEGEPLWLHSFYHFYKYGVRPAVCKKKAGGDKK